MSAMLWMKRAFVVAMLLASQSAFPGMASAQEAFGLAIEGWQETTDKSGVVTYRCASEICAKGSVVSYKAQPHRPTLPLAAFEEHHRGLAAQNKGQGRIRDVRLRDFKEQTVDGVRVLQVNREVDWDDGTTTYTVDARLIGPSRSFSLVSDSPQRDWTANNFEGFLRNLVAIAGIESP
jgi:hypothetical protein